MQSLAEDRSLGAGLRSFPMPDPMKIVNDGRFGSYVTCTISCTIELSPDATIEQMRPVGIAGMHNLVPSEHRVVS